MRVATGGPDQPTTDRLLPSERNPLLIDAQLPGNQAEARSAELIEVRGNLEQLLQRDRIRPERVRPTLEVLWAGPRRRCADGA